MREYIRWLFDYNAWANRALLGACERLTTEQLTMGEGSSTPNPSILDTLVHQMGAQGIWLSRWGGISPTSALNPKDFPTLGDVSEYWDEVEAHTNGYVQEVEDDILMQDLQYKNLAGTPFVYPQWQTMVHVVNHGTQHRAEAAALLTALGSSPGDLEVTPFKGEVGTMIEPIRLLYGYNAWANTRLLDACQPLTTEQFTMGEGYSSVNPSIRDTLVHALSAQEIWLSRWGGVSPTRKLQPNDFPTLADVRAHWDEVEARTAAYVQAVSDEQLSQNFHYTNLAGEPFDNPRWWAMVHVANHGTQHRSEVAALITALGYSPGDMDLSIYMAAQKAK